MERIEWQELATLKLNTLHVPTGVGQQQEKMVAMTITARLTWPGGQEPDATHMPLVLLPPRLLPDVLRQLRELVAREYPGAQFEADEGHTPAGGSSH